MFSGVGGIEAGFHLEGFKTAFFCEIEEFCQKILKKRYPGIEIHPDIRKFQAKRSKRLFALAGGFPCQDISVAGQGKGIATGTRSGLWFEYVRAIGEIRPRYAVIENVPGLFGWFPTEHPPDPVEGAEWEVEEEQGIARVVADLAATGYDAEWRCLSASDVGAPQGRKRAFIIAWRK